MSIQANLHAKTFKNHLELVKSKADVKMNMLYSKSKNGIV